MSYLLNHWIEILGVIVSLVYLFFSIRQKIWLWPFGLVSAIFYIIVYYSSGFYADMGLQFYYVGVSVYGWIYWNSKRVEKVDGVEKVERVKEVKRIRVREGLYLLIAFLVFWVALYFILKHLTDSEIPQWDSLTTAGAIIATWMLARKILENWLVWIVVDALSIALYIWKELYATSVLFVLYTLLAVVGYLQWKKSMK